MVLYTIQMDLPVTKNNFFCSIFFNCYSHQYFKRWIYILNRNMTLFSTTNLNLYNFSISGNKSWKSHTVGKGTSDAAYVFSVHLATRRTNSSFLRRSTWHQSFSWLFSNILGINVVQYHFCFKTCNSHLDVLKK